MRIRGWWLLVILTASWGWAQTDPAAVPTASEGGSPWGAVPPSGGDPSQAPSGGTEGDSFFVPVQPPSEGFDSFEDEEEEPSGSLSRGRRGGGEGKESFKLIERPKEPSCGKWRSGYLEAEYDDKTNCEFELERKVDEGRAAVEELTDRIERAKLKKVIRHEVPKKETTRYEVKFNALQKTLDEALQKGCVCQ